MPFAAIEITKLVGFWISHYFDECVFIYTSYSCFYIIGQILGFVNASGRIRTYDKPGRNRILWSTELLRHNILRTIKNPRSTDTHFTS